MGGVVRWRLVRVYWSYVTLHAPAHKRVAQIARYCEVSTHSPLVKTSNVEYF